VLVADMRGKDQDQSRIEFMSFLCPNCSLLYANGMSIRPGTGK
jgi:hypothetical protein